MNASELIVLFEFGRLWLSQNSDDALVFLNTFTRQISIQSIACVLVVNAQAHRQSIYNRVFSASESNCP